MYIYIYVFPQFMLNTCLQTKHWFIIGEFIVIKNVTYSSFMESCVIVNVNVNTTNL